MIQVLKGIKIIPQGTNNRFKTQSWPNSYAFGGWIYNASLDVGFSQRPTEVKISVVLETSTLSQSQAHFDIKKEDLHCDAGNGGLENETWYDIDFDGIKMENLLLYSYNFSIEAGQKILSVVFKDYSVILDKIYVGLFKKQGYQYPHLMSCTIQYPMRCLDCEYTGASVTGIGEAHRDIGYGAYVGMNGETFDLFSSSYYKKGNVYNEWSDLIGSSVSNTKNRGGQFDLNGGYLMLGTETVPEERCNTSPNVTYSFIELLACLRANGMNITGAFPATQKDSDFVYRANYNGTVREVLQNWCSDLGYDFYYSGRSILGLNLKNPIDITDLAEMADPNSKVGKYFQINAANGNSAILSFNSNTTLENTFKQTIIVENNYPISQREVSKSVKKYVGITPLHPVSLNEIDNSIITDTNIYNTPFNRRRFEVPYFDTNTTRDPSLNNFARLDGRSYRDLDTAIALTNYNPTLRDIFVAQKALFNCGWGSTKEFGVTLSSTETVYWRPFEHWLENDYSRPAFSQGGHYAGVTYWPLNNAYCRANFAALGVFPILEIDDPEFKSNIIEDNFKNSEKNGVSNINIEQKYFRVFLGYYYEDIKSDIVDWERNAASSMYKFGIVTKGNLSSEPFVANDLLNDISPDAGFYGTNGLINTRIQNSFQPSTDHYRDVRSAPFLDTLLYSGYVKTTGKGVYYDNNSKYNPYIPPGFSNYEGRIPTGLWISTLDNEWGITQDQFDRALNLSMADPCAESYTLDEGVSQILTESDKTLQDWRIEYFKPIVNPDLSTISEIIQSDEYNFGNVVDEVMTNYIDTHLMRKKECKKLHIIIIPDTTIHPNFQVEFTPKEVNKINGAVLKAYKDKLYHADFSKNTTQTPSICSIPMIDEMCRNMLTGGNSFAYNFKTPLNTQQTGCVILEDKNNYFLEGFPSGVLYNKNSRSLQITLKKNPGSIVRSPSFDINGDYYYADLDIGLLLLNQTTANIDIIYPIQSQNSIANYSGVLTTDISSEYRIPSLTQVYGAPTNQTNNNTSTLKVINNIADNTLNPILNPLTTEIMSYITVLDGQGDSLVKTPLQYYNYVKNLNNYNLDTPMKTVDLSLAGPPSQFGDFIQYLNPSKGLSKLSVSVSDNGVKTDLGFVDRPKVLPKQESLLNKIGPRIKGNT